MSQKGKATDAPATGDPMDLQPGSKVEVNHEDDVCPRAWYTAIIMERATSTNDKSVDILPLPPPQPPRKFKVGDIVEAYFDDGWYEGKIDQVLDDDKYIFRMSSMFLLFGVKQLRLRRTWLWVPPLDESELAVEEEDSTETDNAEESKAGTGNILEESDQKTKEKEEEDEFSEGARVEVGNNRYLIRFETLRTEEGTRFLEKEMDSLHIRPPPPHIPVPDQFKMFDHVEALYKGGWWKGVIAEVLPDDPKYLVFLADHEKLECKHSDLRPRQGRIDGK
ncbi:protein AGENET DOMAIN (AGD)-CONTAINING P1 [Gossypium hirsutum]|uniref:Protein AGENET DOMAIN (AGD)-CONTAINING P1 n=1 Tax=Gossypium hirsutum TaxID=3635 RepID=A0A1U8KPK8_GOSHI|nr:protein AGENET DOMAIN (AGD)-CONTAINING P1-like [Gossypium hirsutum]